MQSAYKKHHSTKTALGWVQHDIIIAIESFPSCLIGSIGSFQHSGPPASDSNDEGPGHLQFLTQINDEGPSHLQLLTQMVMKDLGICNSSLKWLTSYLYHVLLDLSASFNRVDHRHLISMMKDLGVWNSSLKWFTSYLYNRKQMFTSASSSLVLIHVNWSVVSRPPGSVLGSILVTIYTVSSAIIYIQMTPKLMRSSHRGINRMK